MFLLIAVLALALSVGSAEAQVRVVEQDKGYALSVDGECISVRGVAGTKRLAEAAQSGANAFRTWGNSLEEVEQLMGTAHELDMYVMLGIGLPKDGARYKDLVFREQTRRYCRTLAERYKDDTKLIVWSLGNEINMGSVDSVAWRFVDELAQEIKRIDGRHLVATVLSTASAVTSVEDYCPSIDFVGINSYGGIGGVAQTLASNGYNRPYMITEWGPTGWWECRRTAWGAPIEQTSEQKRQVYEQRYRDHIVAEPRCMGSFVFLWGQKEERTPTWFGLFVESEIDGLPLKGEPTPVVEAMRSLWQGITNPMIAPVVESLTVNGLSAADSPVFTAATPIEVDAKLADYHPEQLTFVWEILYEATVTATGGAHEPRPNRYGKVVSGILPRTKLKIDSEGEYRICLYAISSNGYVATANVPIKIVRPQ